MSAVQFNPEPPLFVIVIGCDTFPAETLNVTEPGPAVSAGAAKTFNVIPTTLGLRLVAMLPFSAASEIEPVYFPAARPADAIVTVKVALPPLVTLIGADTASQPVPLDKVAAGVIVTLPVQAPTTPTVNVCGAGFEPALAEKVIAGDDGGSRVHACCKVNVTGMTIELPTANFVTLSIAAIVTEPV